MPKKAKPLKWDRGDGAGGTEGTDKMAGRALGTEGTGRLSHWGSWDKRPVPSVPSARPAHVRQ
ncbi:hypothetical protein FACS1894104_4040 [Actinomycetota bacterium]|nr:hypothetical protein FACS1894104_4040 [Actinomycetota bacterium]